MRISVFIVVVAISASIVIYLVRVKQLANEHSKGDPFPQSLAPPSARSPIAATNAIDINQSQP